MSRFNLVEEPWIPVIYEEGGDNRLVSLNTLFEDAHQIKTLAGDTRTQDFAVLRVLLAIMHTVYSRLDADGEPYPYIKLDERYSPLSTVEEDDREDYLDSLDETWDTLWNRGAFTNTISRYLEKWKDRFFLFDEQYPFFQVREEDIGEDKINKKNASTISGKFMNRTISESGNKTVLFSPRYDAKANKEMLSADEVARWLIAYQSYTGGADNKVRFIKDESPRRSIGWLFTIGGIYILGKNIFETLMLNLILIHPNREYEVSEQKPCWEYTASELLERYLSMNKPDNLAELYTSWSRAIYIDPHANLEEAFFVKTVQLPEIDPTDAEIEPMTIWRYNKNGKFKNTFTPQKHMPRKSLWRSFGLIALPTSDDFYQRRPGIIQWIDIKRKTIDQESIEICGISIEDDGNPTSRLMVNEVVDTLKINDYVLTDVRENHWVPRIERVVEKTQATIGKNYQRFLSDIAEIRNIKDKTRQGFIDTEIQQMYFEIDIPFRNWLESIEPDESKDEKILEWLEKLRQLVITQAKELLKNASNRDLTGIVKNDRMFNIATAYNSFIYFLNKELEA